MYTNFAKKKHNFFVTLHIFAAFYFLHFNIGYVKWVTYVLYIQTYNREYFKLIFIYYIICK